MGMREKKGERETKKMQINIRQEKTNNKKKGKQKSDYPPKK